MYMYIEFYKLKVCLVFAKSTVQATGIAALTHKLSAISWNYMQNPRKKLRHKFLHDVSHAAFSHANLQVFLR